MGSRGSDGLIEGGTNCSTATPKAEGHLCTFSQIEFVIDLTEMSLRDRIEMFR